MDSISNRNVPDTTVFSIWGYEKSIYPIELDKFMEWTRRGINLGFEINIITDEYWETLVKEGLIADITPENVCAVYLEMLRNGQCLTTINESMFKVALDNAMPFALMATVKHYAKYQFGDFYRIKNMRPTSYNIDKVVTSFRNTSLAWRSAARYFNKNNEDVELSKFCSLQALNTLKMGVQFIVSDTINPYSPYIMNTWNNIWHSEADTVEQVNRMLYNEMMLWRGFLKNLNIDIETNSRDIFPKPEVEKEFSKRCQELHERLMQTCIDYCRQNNLIIVDDLYLSADGLQESIKYGEWIPCTDSSLRLVNDKCETIALSV